MVKTCFLPILIENSSLQLKNSKKLVFRPVLRLFAHFYRKTPENGPKTSFNHHQSMILAHSDINSSLQLKNSKKLVFRPFLRLFAHFYRKTPENGPKTSFNHHQSMILAHSDRKQLSAAQKLKKVSF